MGGLYVLGEVAKATLGMGTGRVNQFVTFSDGTVAAVTEGVYDVRQRRARTRSRFLVEDENDGTSDGAPTGWVTSVAAGDVLHVEQESGSPQWVSVEALWPSTSPVLVLYWLRGVIRVESERASVTVPGATIVRVELSAAAAIAAVDSDDKEGVQSSLDEAQLGSDALVTAELCISAVGTVHAVSMTLPSEDGDLSMEVEFSDLGIPVVIEVPDCGPPVSVEEFVNTVVKDEAEDD